MSIKNTVLFFKLMVIACLAFPLLAQNNNLNNILTPSNMSDNYGLNFSEEELKKITGSNLFGDNLNTSLPTAENPEINNTLDLDNITTVDTTNEAQIFNQMNPNNISKTQKYYEFLTSQILPIFGQNSFSIEDDKKLMFYNTFDRSYQLAPGDILNVTIRGLNPSDKNIPISQDGTIIVPSIRPLHVEGLTLDLAEQKILNSIKIDDFSASVDLSLKAARLVPVQVTGAARFPQTLAIPAYTPLSRILPKVGGIRKDGSFREITLSNIENKKIKIDLYELLFGNLKYEDPIIRTATRIHINDIGLTVAVSGFVNRAGIFELAKDKTRIKIKNLLMLANAKMIPPGANIEILSFDSDGIIKKQKVFNIEDQYVNSGEVLNIELQRTTNVDKITVSGAVQAAYEINVKKETSLAKLLKNGAVLRNDSLLEFAIIKPNKKNDGKIRTVNLRYALNNPNKVFVKPGENVIVINSKIYNLILERVERSEKNSNQLEKEAAESPLKNPDRLREKLLLLLDIDKLVSNTQKIYIDNKISALIPDLPKNSLNQVINERIHFPRDLNLDYGLKIENFGKVNNDEFSINPRNIFHSDKENHLVSDKNIKSNLKFYSNQYLLSLFKETKPLSSLKTKTTSRIGKISKQTEIIRNEIEKTQPVKIFVDNKLIHLISNKTQMRETQAFSWLKSDPEIYPFFIRTTKVQVSNGKLIPVTEYHSLLELEEKDATFSEIEFFTHRFIGMIFDDEQIDITNIREEPKNKTNLEIQSSELPTAIKERDANGKIFDQSVRGPDDIESETREEIEVKNKTNYTYFNSFKRHSKLVSGAVESPGFYPIIGQITLDELISVAGGLLPGADKQNVSIREYGKIQGVTSIIGNKYIDITSVNPQKVILDGHFTIFFPYTVSNADVGSIEIEGEVLHPGRYSFSRNETLEEVLVRAGGFTEAAYPLGASFFRESLKTEQKLSNENLAREVEQSILFLSQSQLTGAGDQINAVVAYANQLKKMPALGKQTLNLEGSSRTMLLEDGDKLRIPKRPSHVTISGSVQNPVTTVYEPEKSLDKYISDAGGLKRNADKKSIFVLLPNGKNITSASLRTNSSLIPAGSVIVIPPKTDKISALGLTDIWSRVLGNIATSILAINAATK